MAKNDTALTAKEERVHARITVIAGVIMVVVSAAQWCAIRTTNQLTAASAADSAKDQAKTLAIGERSAKAAEDAAQAAKDAVAGAQETEAPKLIARPAPFDPDARQSIRVAIRNVGRTAAVDSDALTAVRPGEYCQRPLGYLRSLKTFPATVAPGDTEYLEAEAKLSDKDVATIKSMRNFRLCLFVLMHYRGASKRLLTEQQCFLWAGTHRWAECEVGDFPLGQY
jgi:hypothetical protein